MAEEEFHALMPHTCTVWKWDGTRDSYGRAVVDTEVMGIIYPCLVSPATQSKGKGPDDHTTPYRMTAYIDTQGVFLGPEDVIMLQPPWADLAVVSIDNHYDQTGSVHNVTVTYG